MSLEPLAMGEIEDSATLEDCERLFRDGERAEKRGQLAQAIALKHIHDNRLYAEHGTFRQYVEQRLGYTEQWAFARISLAEIAGELNHGLVAITNERQARAIKPVLRDHGPEVAAEVLREAADDEGKITARSISEAAARVIEPEIVDAEVIDDEPPVLTSQQWMAREGYTDDSLPRRRTEAEKQYQQAEAEEQAIRNLINDAHLAFTIIDGYRHPETVQRIRAHWVPQVRDWTATDIRELASILTAVADQWETT